MNAPPALAALLVLSGPAIGSFLALLADRLPRGEDVVRMPSRCRSCGAPIDWRDKIPILSWLLLHGRCGHCGARLPKRLLVAELAGLGLACVAVVLAATPLHMLLGATFLWCLLGLGLSDLTSYRLPDILTGTLLAVGIGLALEDPGRGLADAALSAGLGAGAFLALRLGYRALRGREGLGLGDVKLMAGIGAGLGALALPVVTLVAATLALAAAAVGARRQGRAIRGRMAVPFGAYLAAGAGTVWAMQLF